jgi:23S rRNA pseudouridine2605 synthase
MRIAKAMAHAGLCSRRDAEAWIAAGRVLVNGKVLTTPAHIISPDDKIVVDGEPLPAPQAPRLWRYNKPRGLVTSHKDPQGRRTVFDALPPNLPRVVSVGRLDINTEGLLLLTTDGALARHLELPSTGWLRRYRVRAHGRVSEQALHGLRAGVTINGVRYGPVDARIDREQGSNVWLTLSLREGKNREAKRLAEHLGLTVNRLIRLSFGPFALGDLAEGDIEEVKRRVLSDQLGPKLAREFGLMA